MASVDEQYQCPWCGRIGHGGYVMSDVGYPICTQGEHSCVWYQVEDQHIWLPEFRCRQLQTIWCHSPLCEGIYFGEPGLGQQVCRMIAAFLVHKSFDNWDTDSGPGIGGYFELGAWHRHIA